MRRAAAGLVAAWLALAARSVAADAATSSPNDYLFTQGDQWALAGAPVSIGAPSAWCVSTGRGIVVADVDTGADFGHPDLAGKLIGGARFTSGNGNESQPDGTGPAAVQDDYGHGTMTTGIIAADTNNGIGIAAVAPDARVLVVKVLDSTGSGYDADVAAGIEWAADNGARVINLSLGPDIPFTQSIPAVSQIPTAIQHAYDRGVAVAIAAGNDSLFVNQYTASRVQKDALVVGALSPDGSIAGYSDGATIYAPGGSGSGDVSSQIVSTYFNPSSGQHGYAYGSGTSFATPQVAGVLALLMARGDSAGDAYTVIRNTAVSRNGVPDLDAARALGASGTCAAGSSGAAPGPGSHASPAPGITSPAAPTQSATSPAAPDGSSPPGATPHTGSATGTLTPVSPSPPSGGSAGGVALGIAGAAVLIGSALLWRRSYRANRGAPWHTPR